MNIVAVDHESAALNDLTAKLRTVFPTSEIKSFQNPIEPLQYAQKHKIDLLFTDVRLRPFDGYELVKILGQTQNFYSYIVSGTKDRPDDLRWMKVTGTFAKPVTVEELTKIRDEIQRDGPRLASTKGDAPAPQQKTPEVAAPKQKTPEVATPQQKEQEAATPQRRTPDKGMGR